MLYHDTVPYFHAFIKLMIVKKLVNISGFFLAALLSLKILVHFNRDIHFISFKVNDKIALNVKM
jgi:hypothetical protein